MQKERRQAALSHKNNSTKIILTIQTYQNLQVTILHRPTNNNHNNNTNFPEEKNKIKHNISRNKIVGKETARVNGRFHDIQPFIYY